MNEVATLRRWNEAGAPWPEGLTLNERKADAGPWWAVQPLMRPEVPAVAGAGWVRTPIDAFVLARPTSTAASSTTSSPEAHATDEP